MACLNAGQGALRTRIPVTDHGDGEYCKQTTNCRNQAPGMADIAGAWMDEFVQHPSRRVKAGSETKFLADIRDDTKCRIG